MIFKPVAIALLSIFMTGNVNAQVIKKDTGNILSVFSLVDSVKANQLTDKVFAEPTETGPEFPGSKEALLKFLSANLKYPSQARKNGIQGRVIVYFVIEKDGTLSDLKIARGLGYGCDEEALRIMKLSPKWTPYAQNYKVTRVAYAIPINFKL